MSNQTGGSILPVGLFLVFITLKLTDVIDWPWIWITAPLWIPLAFLVGFILLLAGIAVVASWAG